MLTVVVLAIFAVMDMFPLCHLSLCITACLFWVEGFVFDLLTPNYLQSFIHSEMCYRPVVVMSFVG